MFVGYACVGTASDFAASPSPKPVQKARCRSLLYHSINTDLLPDRLGCAMLDIVPEALIPMFLGMGITSAVLLAAFGVHTMLSKG